MKDWQQTCQPSNTDSIIGKLMCFDEVQAPQKPSNGKYRALSESYVRNSASVGLRWGSFIATGHQMKGESGLHISKSNNDDFLDKCVEKDVRSQKRPSASSHALRYMQKYEQNSLSGHLVELGVDYVRKSSETLPNTSTAIKLKPHSKQRYIEHRDSLKSGSGKDHHHIATSKELVANDIVSRGYSCSACTKSMRRIPQQGRPRSKFAQLSRTGHLCDKSLMDEVEGLVLSTPDENDFKGYSLGRHRSVDKSSLGSASRKKNVGRCEVAKEAREVGVHVRGPNLDEMLPLADKKSNPLILQSRNSGACSLSAYSFIDFWEDGSRKSLPIFKFETIKEALSCAKQDENTERNNYLNEKMISRNDVLECTDGVAVCAATSCDSELETVPIISSAEREHTSYAPEASGDERLLNEYSKEESSYSNLSRISPPEFQDNLKRTYQQSPDSVLEQFDIQNFSSFENFDGIGGLLLQLEALDFDLEETYSEGSVMLVSGDEDLDERLNDVVCDPELVKTWVGDSRSKIYSYMVDVLDKSGFCGAKSFTDFRTWHSLECPISPSVFEAVEKKYGKQTAWARTARATAVRRNTAGAVPNVSVFSIDDHSESLI
ncbi:Unknown protein [Striga hermonthica]|uniref:DUF4378 domain-containing protein n=1 Tax=Striga hermonthica TaxID=68872 RepID=A0A9N7R0B2_STRHE|nr:Unknown protein [Striga hermonthica]